MRLLPDGYFNEGMDDFMQAARDRPLVNVLLVWPVIVLVEEMLFRWGILSDRDAWWLWVAVLVDVLFHVGCNVASDNQVSRGTILYGAVQTARSTLFGFVFLHWGLAASFAAHLAWNWLAWLVFVRRRSSTDEDGVELGVAEAGKLVVGRRLIVCERCGSGGCHELVRVYEPPRMGIDGVLRFLDARCFCAACWAPAAEAIRPTEPAGVSETT